MTETPAETSSNPIADTVRPGYESDGPALELGGLVLNPTDLSDVHIKIPLKTLQLLAEQLSANGVPVFAADIKGDLSGLSVPGEDSDKIKARARARASARTGRPVGSRWSSSPSAARGPAYRSASP